MAEYSFTLGMSNSSLKCYENSPTVVGYYIGGAGITYTSLISSGTKDFGNIYVIFGAYNYGESSTMQTDITNGDYSKIIGILIMYPISGFAMYNGMLIYNYNGWKTTEITNTSKLVTMNTNFNNGVDSLSVTADNGINSILYNNVTYDTFPAVIPLDSSVTTMSVESKSPVVTINDGGNLKSVTYGSATYTKFPATVTATTPEFALTARGKDSPVITVKTERTQTPVITNT